ncbi:hypothetical protein Gpo141_00003175 [Globisporangium polare]
MKTSAVTLALAATLAVSSVSAQDNCVSTAVRGFLLDSNAKLCATQTGIAWKPFRVYNATEISAYCATESCLTFLATLAPLNPTECKIPGHCVDPK